jgi:serine/threonine protein kinase
MKTEDGPEGATQVDTYATRVPSPDSLEALALAGEAAAPGESRAQGVGLGEFTRGLVDCGFLDAEGVRAALAALPPDDTRSEVEALARSLVRLGTLTRYQASALFQGKGKALLIGPYVVLDKLGSGGMGLVFKARLRAGGPEVALKLLPPSASKQAQSVLRFRREAAILDRLDHPNIVSSHDIGAYHGVHYLIMDYVEGSDLEKLVRTQGPMKVAKAVGCVVQAARGLLAAHERGIVHRDIKPANLLLDSRGVVRVLDLGLARITRPDETIEGGGSSPSLTASGIIMGTVDFLPPEQSDDSKRVDHRADIYGLGCTLHYLLTGKPPYQADSIMQRLLAHHKRPIPSLTEARPDVPAEVDAVFRAMLAKAPEDRPQSMAEVIRALEPWRWPASGAKPLRVFGEALASKPLPPTPLLGSGRPDPKPGDDRHSPDSDTYDLLTFVRSELLERDEGTDSTLDPLAPIPSRRPKRGRGLRLGDLALRVLVALAAIVVLIRFFPALPGWSTTPAAPAPKAVSTPTPTIVEPVPPKVEVVPPKVEVIPPPPSSAPGPKGEPEPPRPGPPEDRPPPLLDLLFGPPPPRGEGPPPPRPGEKRPPRRPGERRPPRPEDGPPGRPASPGAGGVIPF